MINLALIILLVMFVAIDHSNGWPVAIMLQNYLEQIVSEVADQINE